MLRKERREGERGCGGKRWVEGEKIGKDAAAARRGVGREKQNIIQCITKSRDGPANIKRILFLNFSQVTWKTLLAVKKI